MHPVTDIQSDRIWLEAKNSDALDGFQAENNRWLRPFIGHPYRDIYQIEGELKHVSWLIKDSADKTLPQF